MTLLDAGVKCIFCGNCLPETEVANHLQNYHQIKSFFLTPNFRDAETQIEPADRSFIYGRKSLSLDEWNKNGSFTWQKLHLKSREPRVYFISSETQTTFKINKTSEEKWNSFETERNGLDVFSHSPVNWCASWIESYHPINRVLSLTNCASGKGLVRISAIWTLVSMELIWIVPS